MKSCKGFCSNIAENKKLKVTRSNIFNFKRCSVCDKSFSKARIGNMITCICCGNRLSNFGIARRNLHKSIKKGLVVRPIIIT